MRFEFKYIFVTLGFCYCAFISSGQVVNDGGSLQVGSGDTLIIDMNLDNLNGGSIVNEGVISITGTYENDLGSTLTSAISAELTILGMVPLPLLQSTGEDDLSTLKAKLDRKKSRAKKGKH